MGNELTSDKAAAEELTTSDSEAGAGAERPASGGDAVAEATPGRSARLRRVLVALDVALMVCFAVSTNLFAMNAYPMIEDNDAYREGWMLPNYAPEKTYDVVHGQGAYDALERRDVAEKEHVRIVRSTRKAMILIMDSLLLILLCLVLLTDLEIRVSRSHDGRAHAIALLVVIAIITLLRILIVAALGHPFFAYDDSVIEIAREVSMLTVPINLATIVCAVANIVVRRRTDTMHVA